MERSWSNRHSSSVRSSSCSSGPCSSRSSGSIKCLPTAPRTRSLTRRPSAPHRRLRCTVGSQHVPERAAGEYFGSQLQPAPVSLDRGRLRLQRSATHRRTQELNSVNNRHGGVSMVQGTEVRERRRRTRIVGVDPRACRSTSSAIWSNRCGSKTVMHFDARKCSNNYGSDSSNDLRIAADAVSGNGATPQSARDASKAISSRARREHAAVLRRASTYMVHCARRNLAVGPRILWRYFRIRPNHVRRFEHGQSSDTRMLRRSALQNFSTSPTGVRVDELG